MRRIITTIALRMKLSAMVVSLLLACQLVLANPSGNRHLKHDYGLLNTPADIIVKGKISDANGPLAGATVKVDGSNKAVTTDADGNFTISAPENGTLIFSYAGYKEQRVAVKNQTIINITLVAQTLSMDEVIITGYRAQARGSVLGSVSTVKSSEFSNTPVDNLSNALAGRLSGATISQSAGTPGQESNIRVRSVGTFNNSNPLYVIDGIVSDKFAFDGLAPTDVESISILKDGASAAIYGSRAANGVILVTTKRGKEGVAKLNYSGLYGIQTPTKEPQTLSAYEHAKAINDQLRYINVAPTDSRYYTADELDYFKDHSWNWVKEMWVNPVNTQHTLDVSGGARNVKYFLGGSYNYNTGSFNNIDFGKHKLRGKIYDTITNNLKASLDVNAAERNTNGPSWDINNWRMEDLYKALMFRPKMVPPYVNGLPVGNWVEWHPGVVLDPGQSGYNKRKWQELNATVALNYTVPFVKGLTAKTSINRYTRNAYNKQFNLPYNMTQFNTTGANNHIVGDQVVAPKPRTAVEFLNTQNEKIERYQFNAQLNFKRSFGDHNIDALVVYEQAQEDTTITIARRDDFISSTIDQFIGGSTVNSTAGGREAQTARISYVGLISYNYAQKYFIESAFRYDGSTIFAPENRWGFFPSVSAGWSISSEPFFAPVNFINDLKLRASVGLLGNDQVASFQWQQLYNIGYGAIFNNATFGLDPGVYPNPGITWEKSLNYNAGFDARFLNNQISLKLDVFYRHSYDILGSRQLSLPSTLGATLPDENYQQVDSRGFEIELGYNGNIGSGNNAINYYAKGNFGYATSKIVQVDEAQNIRPFQSALGRPVGLQANGTTINKNGNYEQDMLFGYVADGILRTQEDIDALPAGYMILGNKPQLGMLNYKDIRGPNDDKPDGRITSDDRVFLAKYSIPPMNFGFSFGGAWKSLSIDVLLQGVAGAKAMLPTAGRDIQARAEESSFSYWADSWTPDNPNGKYPGWRQTGFRTRYDPSSFWLVDNSFVRLKNVSVSYGLPSKLTNRAGIKSARVFFTGTNLLMIYSGNKLYDPEMNNILSYPMMKAYSFGLNIGL
jgi:TonB-linked SusC/RagA family outer membrane protein